VAIALAYRRSTGGRLWNWARPALGAMVGTLGTAFVLGGWWWALNLIRYGTLQPAAYEIPQGRMAPLRPLDFLDMFAWRVRWNFFAEVGILRSPALYPLAMSLAALFAVLCAAGLLSRRGIADRLMMLVGMGATLGVLIATTYSAHVRSGNLPGIQGRYLFVLIVPIAVFFAVGLVRLAALVRIRARWMVPTIALAGLGVTLLGLALGFRGDYVVSGRSWGEGIDRFFGWAAWSPTVVAGLVGTFVLSGLALAWVLGRQAHRAGPLGGTPVLVTAPATGEARGSSAPARPSASTGSIPRAREGRGALV
jgi:small subunit ribosomal protein S36